MKPKHLLVLASFTALLVPAADATAGVGNGKPTGRPQHAVGPVKPADHPAAKAPGIVKKSEQAPADPTLPPVDGETPSISTFEVGGTPDEFAAPAPKKAKKAKKVKSAKGKAGKGKGRTRRQPAPPVVDETTTS